MYDSVFEIMVRSKYILFILMFFFTSHVAGKKMHLHGSVAGISGERLVRASIIVRDSNNTMIQYALSNDEGLYSMDVDCMFPVTLTAHYIGYHREVHMVEDADCVNEDCEWDFVLNEDNTLPEVVVSSTMEPDTVNVRLDKYILKDDDELKKLLKRNPGFTVGEDGTILYKGKNIDKIFVNGKETFENQNSIALDNIKAGMLAGLQIVNNYKDPFNMSGNDFETVLNLKAKKPSANLTTGNGYAAYGFDDKYNVKGVVMRFSPAVNGFVTNSSNNVNEHTMSLRELTNLFNANMPISSYLADGLNNLFMDKSVYKKDVSNTNFTLRGTWNNKMRLNVSCYYIYDSYRQSSWLVETDGSGNRLYDSDKNYNSKSNSLLLSTDFSYKISPSFIVNYKLRTVYTRPYYLYQNEFSTAYDSENKQLKIRERQYNSGIYNQLNIQYKLSLKNMIDLDLFLNRECDKLCQSLTGETEVNDYMPLTDFRYTKDNRAVDMKWTYSLWRNTNLFLKNGLSYIEEQLHDTIVTRRIVSDNITFCINGVKIAGKVSYLLQMGMLVKRGHNGFGNYDTKSSFLRLPYNLKFTYENRLHRINVENSLSYSDIDFKYAYSRLNNGAEVYLPYLDIFQNVTSGQNMSVRYNYSDILRGRSWGVAFTLDNYRNKPVDMFAYLTDGGINIYKVVLAGKYITLKPSVNCSYTVFPYSAYPVVVSSEYVFNSTNITANENNIVSSSNQFCVSFSSISRKHINFSVDVEYNVLKEKTSGNEVSYRNLLLSPNIKYTSRLLNMELGYSFCKKTIYGSHINRNVNLKAGIDIDKFQFCIIGQNIEKVLGLTNNKNIEKSITAQNGIMCYTYTKDMMSYLLFQIKYKL